MNEVKITDKKISNKSPPFIIAEMSGNHNQSLDKALAIVEAAKKSGVCALKIQTFTADTMTVDIEGGEFIIKDSKSLWKEKSLYKLYQEAHTPWEWHKPIFDRCNELGIIGFSTPFDETAVEFLESLDVPCYKIASFENIDIPLIRKVASTKKPVFISSGMATQEELQEAMEEAHKFGSSDIILLKCTSSYPADPKDLNLMTIPDMRKRFNCQVGISDHSLGIGAAIAGVALGATAIEKHFTILRSDGGVDANFSMEPEEMKQLVLETKQAWQALGDVTYGISKGEEGSRVFRRSLYAVKDIERGEAFTKDNIRSIRPGFGLPPKYYDRLLGKKAKTDIKRGTPLSWDKVNSICKER